MYTECVCVCVCVRQLCTQTLYTLVFWTLDDEINYLQAVKPKRRWNLMDGVTISHWFTRYTNIFTWFNTWFNLGVSDWTDNSPELSPFSTNCPPSSSIEFNFSVDISHLHTTCWQYFIYLNIYSKNLINHSIHLLCILRHHR